MEKERQLTRRASPAVLIGAHGHLALPVDDPPTPLELLNCLGRAALLLGPNAEVIGRNSRVEAMLGDELKVIAGRLVASDRQSGELLKALIRAGTSGAISSHAVLLPPVVIARKSARPIVAQVLHASGLAGPDGEPARAVLLLTALDDGPEVPESRLAMLFGLTPAEARLASRLGTGGALEEIAAELNVSLGTARNQLKSIFSKTGTKRQSELVALLWRVSDLAISTSLLGG